MGGEKISMEYTVINTCDTAKGRYGELVEKSKMLFYENKINHTVSWFDLKQQDIRGCTGCDYCQSINPGQCIKDDGQNEILRSFMTSKVVLMLTSVQFGCCNSQLKNFLDRTEPLFLPIQIKNSDRSMMKGRYEQYPTLIVIGFSDTGKSENVELFKDFFQNCNLAQVCESTKVNVISGDPSIEDVYRLILGGMK